MIIFNLIELKRMYPYFPLEIIILTLLFLFVLVVMPFFIKNSSPQIKVHFLTLFYTLSNIIGISTIILGFIIFLTILADIRCYPPGTPPEAVISDTLLKIEACGLYLFFFVSLSLVVSSYLWIKMWIIKLKQLKSHGAKTATELKAESTTKSDLTEPRGKLKQ
jgi:hypothetical protein